MLEKLAIISFFLTVGLFILLIIRIVNNKDDGLTLAIAIIGAIVGFATIIFPIKLAIQNSTKSITPLDVYRDKTQLVLDYNTDSTYDSIVVWKN